MKSLHPLLVLFLSVLLCALFAGPAFGMIDIGILTKEKAKARCGITTHARGNGDAGVKVWLAFKREGGLEKFTYAELRMEDSKGNHVMSAQLKPNPIHHRQAKDITTVAFSVDASHLEQCSFLVVCYGSNEGNVGYYLKVKDFLDLNQPIADPPNAKPLPSSATVLKMDTPDDATALTPVDVIAKSESLLESNPVRVRFCVGTVDTAPVNRVDNTTFCQVRLHPNIYFDPSHRATFYVTLSEPIEDILRRIGIDDVKNHFKGKTIEVVERLSRSGFHPIASESY